MDEASRGEAEELTPLLYRFSAEVVERSRQISREVISYCLTTVIHPVVSAMGQADVRFKSYVPMPTEHYFEALRVTAAEEYELLVVLDNLVGGAKTFRDAAVSSPGLAGYGEVVFRQSLAPPDGSWAADLGLPLGPTGSAGGGGGGPGQGRCFLLSAVRIRQYFCKLFAVIAQEIFHNGSVQVAFKDPYTQVKISRHGDNYVFLLVPALYFHEAWPPCTYCFGLPEHMTSWLTPEVVSYCRQLGFFAVPLPSPFSQEETLWRLSFVRAEKFLLRPEHQVQQLLPAQPLQAITPQRVRKQVERILKTLRTADVEAFRPLSSYHLRTTVLHVCHQTSEAAAWAPHLLGDRLLQVFRQLIVCLEKGSLPHFFLPTCNLLGQYSLPELLATSQRLRDIHDELFQHPAASIRLQC